MQIFIGRKVESLKQFWKKNKKSSLEECLAGPVYKSVPYCVNFA